MAPLILADIALPGLPSVTGLENHPAVFVLVAFLTVVLLEAVLLRLLRWGSWGRSFLTSLLINLATTLLGFAWTLLPGGFAFLPAWLLGNFVLTVLVEGFLLKALKSVITLGQAMKTSLVINAVSYLLLALLVVLSTPPPRPPRPPRPYPYPYPPTPTAPTPSPAS